MKKKALIVRGGWDGHEPVEVSEVFQTMLQESGFEVEISETLDTLLDEEKLASLHLFVPLWTMGKISKEQVSAVLEAAAAGMGIAGNHGGMCDAFRESTQWQFITGGNWVSHPGGGDVEYEVNVRRGSSPIVEGIKDFSVTSEQYYLHVDPAVEVLAVTRFPVVRWYHSSNGTVDMPVVWTKRWGHGRVFYNSLGHHADIFDIPEAYKIMQRGMRWAAEGRDIVVQEGLKKEDFQSDQKMF
jgi:hypothetical protein